MGRNHWEHVEDKKQKRKITASILEDIFFIERRRD